jgi:hypothetical protein
MPAAGLSPDDDLNRQGISFAQQGKLVEAAQCFQMISSKNELITFFIKQFNHEFISH